MDETLDTAGSEPTMPPAPTKELPEPVDVTVAAIARALGERDIAPQSQIRRIVRHFGAQQARAWLAEALAVEASGGLMLPDESRRRTQGGVYFFIVRQAIGAEERAIIFPKRPMKRGQQRAVSNPAPPAPQETAAALSPLIDAERVPLLRELRAETGKATSVKITLIGRPGRIVEKKDLVLTTMANDKVPSLPKGLPAPPSSATSYSVYISAKQWRGVAAALDNAEDALIIEGWAAYDPELEGIAVWATNCTTKALQRAKREGQQPAT